MSASAHQYPGWWLMEAFSKPATCRALESALDGHCCCLLLKGRYGTSDEKCLCPLWASPSLKERCTHDALVAG